MSATVLPTREQAQQAYSYMIDQIHVPAFLEKLAANGVQPRNQAEVKQLLQLGAVLAQAVADGQIKTAEDTENPFLNHVLRRFTAQPAPNMDQMVKRNADALIQNSELAKTAALIYGHAVVGGELSDDASE